AGQIENLGIELTFDAGGNRILSGTGTLNQGTEGLAIAADLQGPLAEILPAVYGDFFGANTALSLNALMREAGGFEISDLSLTGGSLSLFANAATTPDGFLNRLDITGEIDNAEDAKVVLPVPGASTLLDSARFVVDYGTDGGEDWSGQLEILGFDTPDFGADSLVLNASGVAADLDDPDNRRVTFNGDGTLDGVVSSSEEIS